jgi:UDP-2-acetamido-3-amino-2,3-dideoxy-glucuronate N-acetyltransferase
MRESQSYDCLVRGVRIMEMRCIEDCQRGHLSVGEFGFDLPFLPLRYFLTYAIPSRQTRGEHAHKECAQFLLCVRGSCHVALDDGLHRAEFRLDRPTLGIYVPPMVWATEYKHSHDSTLMVFASHHYDPNDYIRDYGEFLALTRECLAA